MQLKKSNFDNKMQIDATFEKCNVRVSCSVSNFNCCLTHQSHKRENFTLIASFM